MEEFVIIPKAPYNIVEVVELGNGTTVSVLVYVHQTCVEQDMVKYPLAKYVHTCAAEWLSY